MHTKGHTGNYKKKQTIADTLEWTSTVIPPPRPKKRRGFHCLFMQRVSSERVYLDTETVCMFCECVCVCISEWPMLCFFNELGLHTWLIG